MHARIVACAVALLAIAGCGTGTLGEEEFLARGDRLCAALNRVREARFRPTPAARIAHVRRVVRAQRATIAGLEELKPPHDLGRRAARFVAALRLKARYLSAAIEAAGAGDGAALGRLTARAVRVDGVSRELAGDIGFVDCARTVPF